MCVSKEQLTAIMPLAGRRVDQYIKPLNMAMIEFDIWENPRRVTAFLAQIGHESGELRYVSENLNYSIGALMRVWPRRFPTKEVAGQYARNPQKLANHVYANRMGNGPEDTGEGWLHRGAGLIQLTGKHNQTECAKHFGIDPKDIGDWLRTPEGACRSAAWFWVRRGLNDLADKEDFVHITRLINGGTIGLAQRQALWAKAKQVLGRN